MQPLTDRWSDRRGVGALVVLLSRRPPLRDALGDDPRVPVVGVVDVDEVVAGGAELRVDGDAGEPAVPVVVDLDVEVGDVDVVGERLELAGRGEVVEGLDDPGLQRDEGGPVRGEGHRHRLAEVADRDRVLEAGRHLGRRRRADAGAPPGARRRRERGRDDARQGRRAADGRGPGRERARASCSPIPPSDVWLEKGRQVPIAGTHDPKGRLTSPGPQGQARVRRGGRRPSGRRGGRRSRSGGSGGRRRTSRRTPSAGPCGSAPGVRPSQTLVPTLRSSR